MIIINKKKEIEKIEKSGYSGKYSKESNFPEHKKEFIDYGMVDNEDHQLEDKERRDIKAMRELERRGLL